MQVEALLLPLGLHGFAYLNAVPEVARHRWRPHEDPVSSRTLLHSCCHQLVLTCSCKTQHILSRHGSRTHCCGSILVAPLLTGFGGQQWGQVLVRTS